MKKIEKLNIPNVMNLFMMVKSMLKQDWMKKKMDVFDTITEPEEHKETDS